MDAEKFDVCFDTTGQSLQMSNIVKAGGRIVTIAGMATLEELRRAGGTVWIFKFFVKRRVKRKEYKAARSKNADWKHQYLSPSQEDLSTLANHLESGAIKPVLDGVWDFHSEDENDGWKGAFNRSFSGRAMGKCVVNIA
jgi:NADPH:quinone reductase-like Zn-dependent oxidoreductase